MSRCVVGLQVVQPGERADEVLAALAAVLHRGKVRPDSNGLAQVGLDMEDDDAHATIRRALGAADAEWQEYVTIAERVAVAAGGTTEQCAPRRSAVPRPRNRQR